MKNKQWYAQMDGLRCIAVMLVLVEHFILSIGNILGARQNAGRLGVTLFFVISGFLITEGLLHSRYLPQRQALKSFYMKRTLRIFPIYYLLVITAFIVHPAFRQIALYAFTYTFNFLPDVLTIAPSLLAYVHLWTLSIEEQFYLAWPLVIIFLRKPVFIIITMCFVFIFFDTYSWLCAGALLALAKLYLPKQYEAYKFFYVAVLLMAGACVYYFLNFALGLHITISLVLVYLATCNAYTGLSRAFLEHRLIAYVGKISYGIYLYHMPLYVLLNSLFLNDIWVYWSTHDFPLIPKLRYNVWIPTFLVHTTISIVIAHFSYILIEKPLLKLKKRFDTDGDTKEEMITAKA